MNVPFVQLRELTLDDVEDRYQWSLDTQVTKHLVVPDQYPPFTREDTKKWIEACINRKNGYEQRAITAENGIHIGWVDLKNFDKTMLHVAFFEFELEKVWLRVDEDNLQARKSYEKAGFVCEGLMRNDRLRKGQFIHRYRYSMLREEYQSLISSL